MLAGLDISLCNPWSGGAFGAAGPKAPGPVSNLTAAMGPGSAATITFAPPIDPGDGQFHGDGLGVITDHQVSIAFGPWVSVGSAGGSFGFTATAGDTVRVRALGYAGRPGPYRTAHVAAYVPPPAAGPTAPIWSVEPGDDPGDLVVTVAGAPASAGDGPDYGDGLGVITGYEIAIAGGPWVAYGASLPRVVVSTHAPGIMVAVQVRAMGFDGRAGAVSTGSGRAAVLVLDDPVVTGEDEDPVVTGAANDPVVLRGTTPAPVEGLRMASAPTDWMVASGHSLTDAWYNGGAWPGDFSRLRNSAFGVGDYSRKSTIAGSMLVWRWNNASPQNEGAYEADARTEIDRFRLLVITEAGPPARPDVSASRASVASSINYLYLFAERAFLAGDGGNGCETMFHTINPYWEGSYGLGFRESLVEYERVFHFYVDRVVAKMREEHDPAYEMFIMPCHRFWMQVWDDLQIGAVPGFTDLDNLFIDDIHPNAQASYGLACLAFAVIYQVNPATVPGLYVPAGMPTDQRDYWWAIAWEIATTYQRAGMGGSIVGEPGYRPGVDVDPLATPVSVATAPAISPASGAIGDVFSLTLATWSGSTPITTGWTLTCGGVDVTSEVVGLNWTATREGALVLTCTADNLALAPAEATGSAVVGDVLPAALAMLTAAASEGFTWSPALPAASGGFYPITARTQGLMASPARFVIAVVRYPVLPATGYIEPVLALHATDGGNWWMGHSASIGQDSWTRGLSVRGNAGGSESADIGTVTTAWRVLEFGVDGSDVIGAVDGGARQTASPPDSLDPLSRLSVFADAQSPQFDVAAIHVLDRYPDSNERAALLAWASAIREGLA